MSQFTNVTIDKKANIYFDGRVTSRTIRFDDGTIKTLGIMMPGEYTFNTSDKEIMEIMSGEMEVQLPSSEEWITIKGPQSFEVAANSTFHLKVKSVSDYCCHFVQ
ncbi:pyrimidine/purine nucleoside phosphorylase [Sulfuricurvum sp.]|uniref:pyrimidine/purine nucleoside phosphorylase n=1 Tax=Sulfuricurvum sp. TaxID=2025608 RepID=UPI00198A7AE1|nr:pyrimidine/purine nucleoside phosphorylase [Sulfuricurvum sp.]MBD3806635.1 pyrimidine/purine nucleoside phosphorylase [Sulfuricurvum sp.]